MKALEARKATIESQYNKIKKCISERIQESYFLNLGPENTPLTEVMQKLTEDGFDICLFVDSDDYIVLTHISWYFPKDEKTGEIEILDIPKDSETLLSSDAVPLIDLNMITEVINIS